MIADICSLSTYQKLLTTTNVFFPCKAKSYVFLVTMFTKGEKKGVAMAQLNGKLVMTVPTIHELIKLSKFSREMGSFFSLNMNQQLRFPS